MPIDLSHINLTMWIIIGVVVLVGWTILRTVLRLTMRMFSLGCLGLVVLGAIVFVASRLVH
jgi:uncharacterized membrane protein